MTSPIAGGGIAIIPPFLTDSLLPYLNDYWRDLVTTRGMTDLVSQSYPANFDFFAAGLAAAKGKPGSSLKTCRRSRRPFGVRYGICNRFTACKWYSARTWRTRFAER